MTTAPYLRFWVAIAALGVLGLLLWRSGQPMAPPEGVHAQEAPDLQFEVRFYAVGRVSAFDSLTLHPKSINLSRAGSAEIVVLGWRGEEPWRCMGVLEPATRGWVAVELHGAEARPKGGKPRFLPDDSCDVLWQVHDPGEGNRVIGRYHGTTLHLEVGPDGHTVVRAT